jgi:hypothetical protein
LIALAVRQLPAIDHTRLGETCHAFNAQADAAAARLYGARRLVVQVKASWRIQPAGLGS